MCLIITKSLNHPLDENLLFNIIESAKDYNPDGIGYMCKRNKGEKIFINKKIGKNSIEETIKELKDLKIEEGDELAVHLRYGTSGKADLSNVHPFIVDTKTTEILRTSGETFNPCIMHNGVFNQFTVYNSIFSDTYYFATMFLSKYDMLYEPEKIKFLRDNLFTNKLAVMYPQKEKEMILIGTFLYEGPSLRVSNSMYKIEEKNRETMVPCHNKTFYDNKENVLLC